MPTIESGTVADAYLTLLADRGINFLFANAGTDFAPLIEAFAKAQETGAKFPKPVTVPHENVAMAMAMGYYLKSGKPQAVMVNPATVCSDSYQAMRYWPFACVMAIALTEVCSTFIHVNTGMI